MKRFLAFLLGLLGLTVGASAQSDSIKTVGAAEFANIIKSDSVILLDVRTAGEFADGHIDHALNIDVLQSDFKAKAATLSTGKIIAVYCRSGRRSMKAAGILAKAGYKVVNLRGGWLEWQQYEQ